MVPCYSAVVLELSIWIILQHPTLSPPIRFKFIIRQSTDFDLGELVKQNAVVVWDFSLPRFGDVSHKELG